MWKFCGKTQFSHSFHTRKLGEITAFYAVLMCVNVCECMVSNLEFRKAFHKRKSWMWIETFSKDETCQRDWLFIFLANTKIKFSNEPAKNQGLFKGDVRRKTCPCFYAIILTILWKNRSLVQRFGVFWSVLMKLWSYKILNLAWVARVTHECIKHFISGFLCISLLILGKKKLLHSSVVALTFSQVPFNSLNAKIASI